MLTDLLAGLWFLVDGKKVMNGFPPKPLGMDDRESVAKTFQPGDLLVVEEGARTSAAPTSNVHGTGSKQTQNPPPSAPREAPRGAPRGAPPPATNAGSSSIAEDGDFLRRAVPDDNSCLFRSVSYLLGQNMSPASLRAIVATEVKEHPEFYNEASLGRSNVEYQEWIQRETAWGGAIELAIFAKHFKVELAAFDIKTSRMYCYGEDDHYELRAYLLYDGIHYDPLALALGGEAFREMDVTMFGREDVVAENKARAVAKAEKDRKAYTDTQNFKLKCEDCGKILYGEKAAVEHGKSTAHSSFTEA